MLFSSEIETIFSNAACLNCSFLRPGYLHFGASISNSGVAMDDVMACFEMLNESSHREKLIRTVRRIAFGTTLKVFSLHLLKMYVIYRFAIASKES